MLRVDSVRPVMHQARPKAAGTGRFSEMLEAHTVYGDQIPSIRLSDHVIISVIRGEGDYFRAEYTSDSTEEDPIVRISGKSGGGSFDYVRHLRDIRPGSATLPEMYALTGHLRLRQGETAADPVLSRYGGGNLTLRRDFSGLCGRAYVARLAKAFEEEAYTELLGK